MIVELKIKEIRESMGISLRDLSEETGIERHRLAQIEEDVDKILFIEMLVIAENLGKKITDLYDTGNLELQ
nr:MAG TPA: Helix-turn-helix XRE-family like protein [Caudoviricetes sp.]